MERVYRDNWTKKLTKSEIVHLMTDAGCNSFEDVLKTVEKQEEMRRANPGASNEPCWECKTIARKLNLIK